jgi:hypothetical protein
MQARNTSHEHSRIQNIGQGGAQKQRFEELKLAAFKHIIDADVTGATFNTAQ